MANRKYWIIGLLLFFLFFSGCGQSEHRVEDAELPSVVELPNYGSNNVLSILSFVGNKLIFSVLYPNGDMSYHILDLSTGKKANCGTIHNHLFSNNSVVLKGNAIYFRVTTMSDGTTQINNFCKLDIERCDVEVLFSETRHQTLSYLALTGDTILSTNGFADANGRSKTYIEQIEPEQKTQKVLKEFWARRSIREGAAITNISSFGNRFFAIVERYEGEEIIPYIRSYNMSGEETNSFNMRNYSTTIFNTAISNFVVVDGYIYIENMSGVSIFGKFLNEQFVEIVEPSKNLSLAQSTYETLDDLIFYSRESTTIFLFDAQTDSLIETTASIIGNDQTITYMLKSGNTLIVCAQDIDEPAESSIFCLQTNELIHASFET